VFGALFGLSMVLAQLQAGDPAPFTRVVDLDGRPVSLEPEGRVVIVDFFATWCPHCRESLSSHADLIAAFGDQVRIVVVDVKEPAALTRAFFARNPLPEGVVLARDPRGSAMHAFGATAFPAIFVIDRTATVRAGAHGWGPRSARGLMGAVRSILDPSRAVSARGAVRPGARKGSRPPAPATTELTPDERARRMGVEVLR
jgi:thiol-disulfide isomerase/thioredoxin